ncbi:outer membrane protein [Caulobacter ginsengisoli]|uniref:Outer membrane protein n=1 Tax=Caulobacter ginsengisoli TaxID=400775 RepID=A0ABU0ILX8_9CAUL|nr:OmpH family outer membrane protein [Caulobacter ginsengisoli]MDQ0463026.1 outer membrane protein [Caulobacter ginsengisoli]
MTAKKFATAAIGAAVALLIADAALAQATPPKPAATTGAAVPPLSAAPPATGPKISYGPALPGICILNQQRAVVQSMVGKAVGTRLQTLTAAVQAELKTEQTAIETEDKAISAAESQPGADALALQQRREILQARYNAYQRKGQVRDRELQMTQQKALGRIETEMGPVIAAVYQARGCSVILTSDALVVGNPAMDVTDLVVKGLDAKIQTFAFDRERLDQPAAPPKPK